MLPLKCGAGEESRTLDLNLGKVALYQLSYSRVKQKRDYKGTRRSVKHGTNPGRDAP